MYLFCKPKLLRVYKADPALKVQEFKEKHTLLAFGCVSLLWDFAGLLVCFEGIMHSEAFCSVSALYSNKGMFLVSTAYSKTINQDTVQAHFQHSPHQVFQLLQGLQKGSSES